MLMHEHLINIEAGYSRTKRQDDKDMDKAKPRAPLRVLSAVNTVKDIITQGPLKRHPSGPSNRLTTQKKNKIK